LDRRAWQDNCFCKLACHQSAPANWAMVNCCFK
jgi:hypothetical protein